MEKREILLTLLWTDNTTEVRKRDSNKNRRALVCGSHGTGKLKCLQLSVKKRTDHRNRRRDLDRGEKESERSQTSQAGRRWDSASIRNCCADRKLVKGASFWEGSEEQENRRELGARTGEGRGESVKET